MTLDSAVPRRGRFAGAHHHSGGAQPEGAHTYGNKEIAALAIGAVIAFAAFGLARRRQTTSVSTDSATGCASCSRRSPATTRPFRASRPGPRKKRRDRTRQADAAGAFGTRRGTEYLMSADYNGDEAATIHWVINRNHTWSVYNEVGGVISPINSGTWSDGPPARGARGSSAAAGAGLLAAPDVGITATRQIKFDSSRDGMALNKPSAGLVPTRPSTMETSPAAVSRLADRLLLASVQRRCQRVHRRGRARD